MSLFTPSPTPVTVEVEVAPSGCGMTLLELSASAAERAYDLRLCAGAEGNVELAPTDTGLLAIVVHGAIPERPVTAEFYLA